MFFYPITLLWLCLFSPAFGVYVGWPMNEQLPNVARAGESYSFTLASITYRSSAGGSVVYSAAALPDWLDFDGTSRTFSGAPSESDVGTFYINLTGTDSVDGSVLTNEYEMLVSNSSGLRLAAPDVMFTSIAKYGNTNGNDGLVVSQGQNFSIQFGPSVFVENADATRPISSYYGRSADRTSLPNWISFDADSYTFSGTVPYVASDIAPSVLYGFSFIGSDYLGFAGSEGIFYLVVGAHLLSTLLNESIKINGTWGSDFDYTVPVLSSVYLDGALIEPANISSVDTDNLPSYVTFDEDDYTLTGTFPNASAFENFTVVVSDVYGNLVDLPYTFDLLDLVFAVTKLPNVNATRGAYFQLQLMHSYFTDFDATTVTVTSDASWLTYHEKNMTLTGWAPSNLASANVTVKASSDFGTESLGFEVVGVSKKALPSSSLLALSSASASATSTPSASSSAAAQNKSSSSDSHHKLVLGLAIGLPLLALLVGVLILLFCCCRRRNKETDTEKSESEPEITGPGFGVTYDMDDHAEDARQLGTLNALKLDQDNTSTLSSLTHVDSDTGTDYFDASEKPVKSWRANNTSDASAIKEKFISQQRHTSQLSTDTVNTDQLFSVRLVDDGSARNSSQSNNILSSSLIRDTSLENVQRLDSDGNLADRAISMSPNARSSLNNIEEEGDNSNTTFYNSANDSSSFNLMAKFLNDGSNNNSDFDAGTDRSLTEDFKPIKSSLGEVEWRRSLDMLVPSPDSETFLLNQEPTPKNNAAAANTPFYDMNQSRTSVYSELSAGRRGSKAKLVEFTRKASLRESARHQNVEHLGETAQIHDSDSD